MPSEHGHTTVQADALGALQQGAPISALPCRSEDKLVTDYEKAEMRG
jgi:hypothetical protein